MKRKYLLLIMTGLMGATSLTPVVSFAQSQPDELTEEMQPVGNHAVSPDSFGGQNKNTPTAPKHNNDDFRPGSNNPPTSDDNFRPAPPDTSSSGPINGSQSLGTRGSMNMGAEGASLTDNDNSGPSNNNGNNPNGTDANGLVSLPDRSKENKAAELDEALRELLPPPGAMRQARQRKAELERESAAPIEGDLKPLTRTINMTLRPGEAPPTIHLALGAVTTLTFSDITGSPWYVTNVVTDELSYKVTKGASNDDLKSNIVTIYPRTRYSAGRNVSIMLEHASVPVILQLDTAMQSNTVDYRADITVMQRGPNAREDYVEEGTAPAQDADIQGFIDGLPPKGAKTLKTSDPSVEAWKFKNMMYVRTAKRLMAPIWIRKSHSNLSGDTVYVLRPVPDITVSSDGNLFSVMVKQ